MSERTYTDEQIEQGIHKALQAQNVQAVAGLIALLALQNPQRADQLRQTILYGLSLATTSADRADYDEHAVGNPETPGPNPTGVEQ